MKKKVIIVSHCLELGGAETSLISLLKTFDTSRYDVDLFLYRHSGELMNKTPDGINLLPEISRMASIAKPMKSLINFPNLWCILVSRLFAKSVTKAYYQFHKSCGERYAVFDYIHKFVVHFLPEINPNTNYDLAISFLTPHYIAMNKINAKKKIAWIHTDYSTVDINVRSERKIWSKYDNIISISDKCTEGFVEKFPELESKIIKIENILNVDYVREKAQKECELSKYTGEIVLCSVGRYVNAKNFDNVPAICKHMVDNGYNIKWYIIGYGLDEELIKEKISEANMEKNVILLGKKENPYPYMNACDIYVQPSRYEGKAVTVREAQALAKPVVITNFPTAKSQLEDGVDGIIVPMDNKGCAKGIMLLIDDKNMQKMLIDNCKSRDYSNRQEIEKLCKIIEKS